MSLLLIGQLISVVALILFSIWLVPRIGRYELTPNEIAIYLVGFPVCLISYADIESIRAGHCWWGLNFHSAWNAMWTGREVTIRRRRGLFKNINLSPLNRDAFVRDITARRDKAIQLPERIL